MSDAFEAFGVFGVGALVRRPYRIAVRRVFARFGAGGRGVLLRLPYGRGRAAQQLLPFSRGEQYIAVGGKLLAAVGARCLRAAAPSRGRYSLPARVPCAPRCRSPCRRALLRRPLRAIASGRCPLFSAISASNSQGRAAGTGGIDRGDARVGLAEQVEFSRYLCGVAFGRHRWPCGSGRGRWPRFRGSRAMRPVR